MEGSIVVVSGLVIFAVAALFVTLRAEKKEREKKARKENDHGPRGRGT